MPLLFANPEDSFLALKPIIIEPRHEISNNVVCATRKASDWPAHMRSLITEPLLVYSTSVKLLTEHHLGCLSLKEGCTGLSVATLVKMPHCWKSHATAHMFLYISQGSHRLEKYLN